MVVREQERDSELALTVEKYKNHVNPSLAKLLKFSGYYAEEAFAEGIYVYDEKGNRYIDCAGGYGVFVLGHRHRAVIDAVKKQLDIMPLSSKVFFNRLLANLAEKISSLSDNRLKYSFFCNSGAEAIEGAIKIARLSTGRSVIVSAVNSFHGKTLGALSVSGRDVYKKPFQPLLSDTVQVPFDDVKALKEAVSDRTAAVIIEPIQGEGGIIVPSSGYFAEVRRICNDSGALFIADEIQSGMGRTGRFFALEHWNVWPDMITLAKGLGGGVMPIGAIIGTQKVWDAFKENPLIHTSTFGGNQAACAAALATIETIFTCDLIGKASENGDYFIKSLDMVREDYPDIIAQVRGRGLMIGVELIKESFGGSIIFEMARNFVTGVYTLNNQKVIRFEPPLIIEKEQIDEAVKVFRKSVEKTRVTFSR